MIDKHNITFIGPEKSGKTQIVNRVATDNDFVEKYKVRTGTLNTKKTYPEKGLQIEYTDYGPDIQAEQINSGLTKASKICLVFDATDKSTDKSAVQNLIAYLSSKGITLPAGTQLLIVGNKIDLLSLEQISDVSRAANEYAQTKGATFLAVSAKNKTHIDVLIDSLITGLPVGLSSSVTFTRRSSLSQRSIASSTSNRQNLGEKVTKGAVSIEDLAEASDEEDTLNTAKKTTLTIHDSSIRTYSPSRARSRVQKVPPADTTLSFALRLAGMALIVTAITSLIYLAIVAAGFVSSVVLTGVVNQVVVTVGGLLGMSAPVAALTQFFATYGISAVAGSELLAVGASLLTLGVGYGLRRLGQKPAAANDEDVEAVVASRSMLSTALRYVGMALMMAALVNAIYLLLIAIGGLLGFAAPVTAFGNACAAIGLSTTAATGALSATGSLLMAGIGYSMFRRNAPVRSLPPRDELTLSDRENDGRTTPPLREREYS
jgi:GTPase SAR1 family protein